MISRTGVEVNKHIFSFIADSAAKSQRFSVTVSAMKEKGFFIFFTPDDVTGDCADVTGILQFCNTTVFFGPEMELLHDII